MMMKHCGDGDGEFDLENTMKITLSLKATADTLRINVEGERFSFRFQKNDRIKAPIIMNQDSIRSF